MDEGNGMTGEWAAHCVAARPIDVEVKQECLRLFRQGMGYHRAAKSLGLKPYTVRDWLRRFKRLDDSWATTDGWGHWRRAEARDLVKYQHEFESDPECRLPHDAGDRSGCDTKGGVVGGEGQAARDAEQDSALPPFSAAGAWSAILAGGCRKKKEIEAVENLVAQGYDRKSACIAAGISRATYYRAILRTKLLGKVLHEGVVATLGLGVVVRWRWGEETCYHTHSAHGTAYLTQTTHAAAE